jgi:hypothetical protein
MYHLDSLVLPYLFCKSIKRIYSNQQNYQSIKEL